MSDAMSDAMDPLPASTTENPLRALVDAIGCDPGLDGRADILGRVAARVGSSTFGPALRGRALGHALHPALTDLPLGCWTSATLLDLIGGRRGRRAAQRLVGVGLLGAVPTALTGLADFERVATPSSRRVATVHAAGNGVVTVLQFMSWRARRRDRHVRGVLWGLAGTGSSLVTGYLGGHLLSHDGAGVGERWPEPHVSAPHEPGMPPAPLPDEVVIDSTRAGTDAPMVSAFPLWRS